MKLVLIAALCLLSFYSSANVGVKMGTHFAINGEPSNPSKQELIKLCENGNDYSTCSLYADTLPKALCLAGGTSGSTCSVYADTLAKGICLAGGTGGSTCSVYADTLAKGICLAGGISGSTCNVYAESLPAGICLAKGGQGYQCSSMSLSNAVAMSVTDTVWAWDKFTKKNSYNNIWACRGRQTGQFADEAKCAGQYKSDSTWPNN